MQYVHIFPPVVGVFYSKKITKTLLNLPIVISNIIVTQDHQHVRSASTPLYLKL